MTSAPASSSPFNSSRVPSTDGSPAGMYGTNPRRLDFRRSAKRSAMALVLVEAIGSDEVVANPDAIALGRLGLHDRPAEVAIFGAIGHVDDRSRIEDVALSVADDPHERTREHFGDRIHYVDDAQFVRVADDQCADRIDAGETDERLHDNLVHAAARIVTHLANHVGRSPGRRPIHASRGRGVKTVADCDDLAEDAHLPGTD